MRFAGGHKPSDLSCKAKGLGSIPRRGAFLFNRHIKLKALTQKNNETMYLQVGSTHHPFLIEEGVKKIVSSDYRFHGLCGNDRASVYCKTDCGADVIIGYGHGFGVVICKTLTADTPLFREKSSIGFKELSAICKKYTTLFGERLPSREELISFCQSNF